MYSHQDKDRFATAISTVLFATLTAIAIVAVILAAF